MSLFDLDAVTTATATDKTNLTLLETGAAGNGTTHGLTDAQKKSRQVVGVS